MGMRQLRLPVLDYCAPSPQQLESGLDFIRRQPPGCSVYVHCKAGRGRAGTSRDRLTHRYRHRFLMKVLARIAGTMLMGYLMDERGLTPQQVLATLYLVAMRCKSAQTGCSQTHRFAGAGRTLVYTASRQPSFVEAAIRP